MPRVQWDSRYATGDPTIDSQHRELLAFADALLSLSPQTAGREVLDDAFRTLFEYMGLHFRQEEDLWRTIGSPLLGAQTAHHAALRDELQAIWSDDRIGQFSETLTALSEWLNSRLLAHIIHDDTDALAHAAPR